MWRDYFGPKVRIIGIDFNPMARRWENDGFEIFIGNQSDPLFWKGVFNIIGDVDIILDDGGHTYEQQIVTAHECIPRIRDGGLLIVEDTHTSYFKGFGYPSKYSFIEWTKRLIDNINSRFPAVKVCNLPYKIVYFQLASTSRSYVLRFRETNALIVCPHQMMSALWMQKILVSGSRKKDYLLFPMEKALNG